MAYVTFDYPKHSAPSLGRINESTNVFYSESLKKVQQGTNEETHFGWRWRK